MNCLALARGGALTLLLLVSFGCASESGTDSVAFDPETLSTNGKSDDYVPFVIPSNEPPEPDGPLLAAIPSINFAGPGEENIRRFHFNPYPPEIEFSGNELTLTGVGGANVFRRRPHTKAILTFEAEIVGTPAIALVDGYTTLRCDQMGLDRSQASYLYLETADGAHHLFAHTENYNGLLELEPTPLQEDGTLVDWRTSYSCQTPNSL